MLLRVPMYYKEFRCIADKCQDSCGIGWEIDIDQVTLEKYKNYKGALSTFVGPTEVMISGDTLQVDNYDKYNWTYFDPEAKKKRHETVFPEEKKKAFALGAEMVKGKV